MPSLLRILTSTRHLWPLYLSIALCSVATAATGLVTPFVIKSAIDLVTDGGIDSGTTSRALWLAGALLLAELANTVLTNIGGYLGDTATARLRATLSLRYYTKLLALPQRYFDTEVTGTIINRLNRSITETTGFLNMFANSFLNMLLTVLAALAITAMYSWPMAILLATIYPLFMWLTTRTSAKWQVLENLKNAEVDQAGGRFAEVVGQIRVVKSFVQERRELAVFRRRYDETVDITRRQSAYWHRMDVSRRAVLNIIFFALFAMLFVQTANGSMTLGVMILLIQMVTLAKDPVFSMSFLVDFAQRAIVGSKDYFEAMAQDEESTEAAALAPEGENGNRWQRDSAAKSIGIEFHDVSFSYGHGEQVLDRVSFQIKPGEHVAIVGESGGGKTTLVNLLLRFYAPTSGHITLDGQDIASLPLGELRAAIGMVFQDPSLFSGTIRENIAYADILAGEDEVAEAALLANADGFVRKFAHGYDSPIGERGVRLSGGQKQRIAVARAILKDAPVLVLDEATSSLDSKAERLVQEGLDRLTTGRTTLIIAHRLSTISSVDRIVTLREGSVDEVGTPAQLAHSGGIYSELLALQSSTATRDRKRLRDWDIQG